MASQLVSYLESNCLFSKFQSGFRKCHGVETALLKLFNDIFRARDQGHFVVLVLLDVSAAFDTIDHEILFKIMEDVLGIGGVVLDWFKSYLSCRSQVIRVNGVRSDPVSLLHGVPQGSQLGPVVFAMYLIPLYMELEKLDISYHGYADDNQLYCSGPSFEFCQDQVSRAVRVTKNWCSRHKLKLNSDKTQVITFPKLDDRKSCVIDGQILDISECVKNLGVKIDQNLSLDKQINEVCKTSFYYLKIVSSHKQSLDKKSLEQVIHSYVLSHLNSNLLLYYGLPSYRLEKLQRVQNCAARCVAGTNFRDHISPVLSNLNWLKIRSFIKYRYACFIYKCLDANSEIKPEYLSDLLEWYNPSRTLRSQALNLLVRPSFKKEENKRSFTVSAPIIWNDLPLEIRNAPSLPIFKRNLKLYLLEEQKASAGL